MRIKLNLSELYDAVFYAERGWPNSVIQERTGLTDHQITYRLRLGAVVEKFEKGIGYRKAYRSGQTPLAQAELARAERRKGDTVRRLRPKVIAATQPQSQPQQV